MKGTRHSEEQIIAILKQGEAGLTTAESCRQHGITEQTCYRWKAKYGGMDSGEGETPSPAPDLIPAETKTSTENLHWDRYSKRGHFTPTRQVGPTLLRARPS
jgi:transposase-like protein